MDSCLIILHQNRSVGSRPRLFGRFCRFRRDRTPSGSL